MCISSYLYSLVVLKYFSTPRLHLLFKVFTEVKFLLLQKYFFKTFCYLQQYFWYILDKVYSSVFSTSNRDCFLWKQTGNVPLVLHMALWYILKLIWKSWAHFYYFYWDAMNVKCFIVSQYFKSHIIFFS